MKKIQNMELIQNLMNFFHNINEYLRPKINMKFLYNI